MKDLKNKNTLWFIKKIDELNLNAVIKLALNEEFENSIITVFPFTDKKLKNKLMQLENLLKRNS